jgi:hypothetical protein
MTIPRSSINRSQRRHSPFCGVALMTRSAAGAERIDELAQNDVCFGRDAHVQDHQVGLVADIHRKESAWPRGADADRVPFRLIAAVRPCAGAIASTDMPSSPASESRS